MGDSCKDCKDIGLEPKGGGGCGGGSGGGSSGGDKGECKDAGGKDSNGDDVSNCEACDDKCTEGSPGGDEAPKCPEGQSAEAVGSYKKWTGDGWGSGTCWSECSSSH